MRLATKIAQVRRAIHELPRASTRGMHLIISNENLIIENMIVFILNLKKNTVIITTDQHQL